MLFSGCGFVYFILMLISSIDETNRALYSESLGEGMGIYDNDVYLFGRYASEMFRAVRLVVDTGPFHSVHTPFLFLN